MWTTVAPKHSEFFHKDILSVTSLKHTIIDNQLLNHFVGFIAMKRQIFTVTVDNLSILLNPVLDSYTFGAFMLHQPFRSNVLHVFFAAFSKFRFPFKRFTTLCLLQILNGLFHSFGTLVCSDVGLPLSPDYITIHLTQQFLKLRNEGLRILAYTVNQGKDLLVQFGNVFHFYFKELTLVYNS